MSDRFIVSARKYRPATFDTVVGQGAVTDTLKSAIRTQHLAQAFLFTGPRGVGKTTCARILARTINCENLNEDLTTCGECAPCRTFEEGHSLNIFELDAASNNSVDNIRDLILQVSIAPQVGTKKVYIIDEVHMLSSNAFNAFLKTLEEPPSYAIFILATTEKHKILPTILSRCQVFDFRRITVRDIATHLMEIAEKEDIEAEPAALHTIAQKADGGLRDALSIFDQLVSFSGHRLTYQDVVKNLNVLDHEHYFSITDHILHGDSAGCLVELHTILQNGFDGHLFIAGLGAHFRDLLVCQDPRTLPLLEVSEDLGKRYLEQAAAAPRHVLIDGLERISQCDAQYKNSKEPRLLVELTLIQLCRLVGVPVEHIGTVQSAQKKSPDGSSAIASPAAALKIPVPAKTTSEVLVEPALTTAEVATAGSKENEGPEVASPRPGRRLANQVSISKFAEQVTVSKGSLPVLADVHEEDGPGGKESAVKPLSPTLLLKAWNDHALAQKKAGKNSLHATLTAKEPIISGPHRITFSIVNDVQENYMRDEKGDLMAYLRRELEDPRLELEVVKEAIVDVPPRYTQLDRFKILAAKNPALLKLKDALDLDLG